MLDDFPDPGYGPDGFHTSRYVARIAAYGSRVLVANNLLPRSQQELQVSARRRSQRQEGQHRSLFDYGKTIGIDVNKELLARRGTDGACPGYFEEGVVVRDNYVFNHGHTGYNVPATWVTIADNRNERAFLPERELPTWAATWVLTLDGWQARRAGIGQPLARLRPGRPQPLDRRQPLQQHRLVARQRRRGHRRPGQARARRSIPGRSPTTPTRAAAGRPAASAAWTPTATACSSPGTRRPAGSATAADRKGVKMADCAFVANKGDRVMPDDKTVARLGLPAPLTADAGRSIAPTKVTAEAYQGDAVKVAWADASDGAIGFRVERRIGDGKWQMIAYRPPRPQGDAENPQEWVDFTAPPGKELTYRVVAVDADDDDKGASKPSEPVSLTALTPLTPSAEFDSGAHRLVRDRRPLQPLAQPRTAPGRVLPLHRHLQRLAAADQHHQLLAARDAGVEQVALQHHEMLRVQRDHHRGILRALRFVDRQRVGQSQLVQFAEIVGHRLAVEIDGQLRCSSASIAAMRPMSPLKTSFW